MNEQSDAQHLILYDGVCGLCNRLNQLIIHRDRHAQFAFASIQGTYGSQILASHGIAEQALTTMYVIKDFRSAQPHLMAKGEAALFVASGLGWPWRAAVALRILPQGVLDWMYEIVARNRYRVFGRSEACALPRPEDRGRFLEA